MINSNLSYVARRCCIDVLWMLGCSKKKNRKPSNPGNLENGKATERAFSYNICFNRYYMKTILEQVLTRVLTYPCYSTATPGTPVCLVHELSTENGDTEIEWDRDIMCYFVLLVLSVIVTKSFCGVLRTGNPLKWSTAKPYLNHVRISGVKQFLNHYTR